jgi:hypothetical protein
MKKASIAFVIMVVSLSLFSCNAKAPTTKEFAYLPLYTGMQLNEFIPSNDETPLDTGKYTLKNMMDVTTIYQNYQSILDNEGWTITKVENNISISAEKGNHIVNITFHKSGNDVILVVKSK